MNLREASPSAVRGGAHDLRTTAAGLGLAAWAAASQRDPVRVGWWGGNGERWLARDAVLVQALRDAEQRLRTLAGLTQGYADELERLQRALRDVDEQLLAVQASQDRAARDQGRADPATRGPRPDDCGAAGDLRARARALEAEAERVGHRFARQVLATLETVPRVEAVRTALHTGYLYGYALPAGVGAVAMAPELAQRRPLLPAPLRAPLRALDRRMGPARVVANADVAWNGSGRTGARGGTDRIVAGADILAVGGVYLGGGAAAGAAVAPWLVGLGVVTAGYTVTTWAWDVRPRPRPRRPSRPPVPQRAGPVAPGPRLGSRPGAGLRPAAGPVPGFRPVDRPAPGTSPGRSTAPPRSRPQPTRSGSGPVPGTPSGRRP